MNRRDFIRGALTLIASTCLKLRPERQGQLDEITCLDIANTYRDDDSFRILALGGRTEIAYSDDMGETFYLCDGPPVDANPTCIAACEKERWYVGFSNGELWKTQDAGKSWEDVSYTVTPAVMSW